MDQKRIETMYNRLRKGSNATTKQKLIALNFLSKNNKSCRTVYQIHQVLRNNPFPEVRECAIKALICLGGEKSNKEAVLSILHYVTENDENEKIRNLSDYAIQKLNTYKETK